MTVNSSEEPMNDGERKRFYIMSVVLLLVAALVTGGFIYFSSRPDNTNIKSSIPLTAEDKAEGERVAKEFIERAGTWGLRPDSVNKDNIQTAIYSIQQNTQAADTYWLSRNASYTSIRTDLVAPNSPMWTDQSLVEKWWDQISRDSLSSFETLTVDPTIPETYSMLTVGDTESPAMTVPVKYTVRQRKYVQTVTDSSWDGTYIISKRVYEENAQLTLVKMGDGWRVYQITGNKYPFLLSSWNKPDSDYNAEQFGFEEESLIKAEIGDR